MYVHKAVFSLIARFHTFVCCVFHTVYEDKHFLGSEGNREMDKKDTDRETSERKEGWGGTKKVAEKSLREKALLLLNIKVIGHATLLRTLRASLSCRISACLESQPDAKRFVPLCCLTLKVHQRQQIKSPLGGF